MIQNITLKTNGGNKLHWSTSRVQKLRPKWNEFIGSDIAYNTENISSSKPAKYLGQGVKEYSDI